MTTERNTGSQSREFHKLLENLSIYRQNNPMRDTEDAVPKTVPVAVWETPESNLFPIRSEMSLEEALVFIERGLEVDLAATGLISWDCRNDSALLKKAKLPTSSRRISNYLYRFTGVLSPKFASLWLRHALASVSRSIFLHSKYINIPERTEFPQIFSLIECLSLLSSMGLSRESCPWAFDDSNLSDPEQFSALSVIAGHVDISEATVPYNVFHMLCAASSFMQLVEVWKYCADMTGEKIVLTEEELSNNDLRDEIFEDFAHRTGVAGCLESAVSRVPIADIIV